MNTTETGLQEIGDSEMSGITGGAPWAAAATVIGFGLGQIPSSEQPCPGNCGTQGGCAKGGEC